MSTRSIWAIAVSLSFVVTGCVERDKPQEVVSARNTMGTFARVTAVASGKSVASAAVETGYDRLEDVNRLMSDYNPDSEVGRLNNLAAGESMVVSPETFECIKQALAVGKLSGGAFDITCRPIVSVWKNAGKQKRLPTTDELDRARVLVGWDKVILDSSTRRVSFKVPGMQIDLGGIAKGYALDLAAGAMIKNGAAGVLVDVGGDVVARGRNADGKPWRIGIKHPFQEGLIGVVDLVDMAVATSGDQQRFSIIDGKKYSHIIDPRTAQPAREAPCVTVIAKDGITADAWGTVLSVLSIQEGKKLIESAGGPPIEVMWMTQTDGSINVVKTRGFSAYMID